MSRAVVLVGLLCLVAGVTWADTNWKEGEQYFLVLPPQPTSVAAGKVEVLEVFSYACPACNLFNPTINKLKASLPANVQWRFLPASWHAEEDWKVFQRAYFAAQSLGIAERTHDKIFDAIWKTHELAIIDPATKQIKDPLPSLADVAKYYEGLEKLKPGEFLEAAHSFSVDAKMREADAQIRQYQVDETPSVIVNGKYRVTPHTAGGNDQFMALVQWLVKKESK
jgi:protein dithiol oxidoreductase (disulfide-forming)